MPSQILARKGPLQNYRLHPLIHTFPTRKLSTRCREEKSGAEAPPVGVWEMDGP